MNNVSLHYFIVVAEELNITKAAERLFITQQSLSEHIKKLEKNYDAVFFERTPRLRLTYQGERMLTYARKVVEAENELSDKLREDKMVSRTRLNIGQTSSRGTVFMPTIFGNYHAAYPNVVLSIMSGNHEYIENQLRLGKIEMYMGMSTNNTIRGKCETMYRDKLYYIISKELLKAHLGFEASEFIRRNSGGISITQTLRFPMALPPQNSSLRMVFESVFAEHAAMPDVILETVEHDIMFDVCKNGLCGCFVSREILYRKIMHKSLPDNVLYFPADGFDGLSCFDIVYSEREISSYARSFVDCCRSTVKKTIEDIDSYLYKSLEIKL